MSGTAHTRRVRVRRHRLPQARSRLLTPDVVEQRRATLRALGLRPGERVLDVGSGPGLLVAEMAQAVGPAGHVTGLDVSDAMLALGHRRCAGLAGLGRASFVKADATTLPFADTTFDVAVSTQVYEYVGSGRSTGWRTARSATRNATSPTCSPATAWPTRSRSPRSSAWPARPTRPAGGTPTATCCRSGSGPTWTWRPSRRRSVPTRASSSPAGCRPRSTTAPRRRRRRAPGSPSASARPAG